MRSTFMGLETSKRGMFTQQTALYTTGHNISNANTLGYSRQRVNMQPTLPYPGIGLNAPKIPGFIGTGVEAHSIQRVRDQFIDRQFRQESNELGYWDAKSRAITQMEDVMTEPSKFGLNESLDLFWKSLQDLSTTPENAGARKVVTERGVTAAESFNYIYKQLAEIQGNLKNEIDVSTKDVNSILKQIAALNENISKVEPNGYMPNDLYDARDTLIDELSQYFPIQVDYVKTGGNSLAIAEGTVTISLKTNSGLIELVKGKEASQFEHNLPPGDNKDPFQGFTINGAPTNGVTIGHADLQAGQGKMLSIINSYGYGNAGKGDYPEMLAQLDKMAKEFANAFNAIHRAGFGLPPDNSTALDFFVDPNGGPITAGNIAVNQVIKDDPNKVAASTEPNQEGNGKNAMLLAGVKTTSINGLGNATVQSFYQSLIGKLGVDGEQANRLAETSGVKMLTIANNRASVSSVSLDEEMTNMITFQQAYNASARMITVVDETLDKIINGMGRVGL
ncbi:flagellar hook-associated protein FlgK [Psychrobacillus vulpis]|uniref:Flagellar hook-associated protein 1 n=1 Tax=Psychrobacillus vulpis TaxID=2325572 RepID=A0A544TIT7_9BACI|nr:flagellar hook-associated protein FlgK [Psychrobacillus vulpis]TQR17372.1 flagellar hook-associated protein FlgK [Psychrobacillus vulpis]